MDFTDESETVKHRMSLPAPAQPVPAHKRSPAIAPLPERRGSRIVRGWSKRRVHRWRSPVLMVCFYLLGLSMSIAHCVFYPKLRGRVVGNSDNQEEKIRYCVVLGPFSRSGLISADSALPLPSLLRFVSQQVHGQHIHSGCGGL